MKRDPDWPKYGNPFFNWKHTGDVWGWVFWFFRHPQPTLLPGQPHIHMDTRWRRKFYLKTYHEAVNEELFCEIELLPQR